MCTPNSGLRQKKKMEDNKADPTGGEIVIITNREEKETCRLPSHSLMTTDVVETPEQFDQRKQTFANYRPYFKNDEQFEYFTMLPISSNQRGELLRGLMSQKTELCRAEK